MGKSENYLFFGTYCSLRSQSCLKHSQGLTNEKNFHLPTGQVKKKITCPVEKLACPDFIFLFIFFFFSKIKKTLLYTLHSLKFGHRV